ncbi:MAG: PD-(D/E)XK nuclease family protein [Deltaproteobacteria bacterium]|nr:PD-(D/E)XK nuclease family protein [Deltaproteobacteria bacterium]
MASRIVVAPAAAQRLDEAEAWLPGRARDEELLVVGPSLEAAAALVRRVSARSGAAFGWRTSTLPRVAAALAAPVLAARGDVIAGALVLEAICARIVHDHAQGGLLGRFQAIADRPGLVRALARTFREVRLAGLGVDELAEVDGELAPLLAAYARALAEAHLADRASVLRVAASLVAEDASGLGGVPLLLLDVPVDHALEASLLGALTARAPDLLAVHAAADARSTAFLQHALASATRDARTPASPGALGRLQSRLFDPAAAAASPGDDRVVVVSAPGESRECVEIARRILREVERGVPFDRIAVLLRAPSAYRPHLVEAFRRARVPAHFAQGVSRPDATGRAFLALLGCAAEGLSARRFAEYLSLGQVPERTVEGAPPAAPPAADRWVKSDDELLPPALARPDGAPAAAVDDETLRSPRRWERLLVEAAVIGGRERWVRRLAGLRRELELDLAALDDRDPDAPRAVGIRRSLDELSDLRAFALPLLEALDALPELATWQVWLEALSALATRALRRPERVLSVLSELAPMGPVGPVDLSEVRMVLAARLRDLLVPPQTSAGGRVLVAPIELARGLAFDAVFVPGLAEKIFPQKVVEDPILRDDARAAFGRTARMRTNADRIADERLALHLAVGCARERVILSYPRIDLDQARPRVPSFYGLEVLRASEGQLFGFEELTRRAEDAAATEGAAATRLGWPAPSSPRDAIDEAEHDLSLLASLLHRPSGETKGTARYLLDANVHLARALRCRARRWIRRWTPADGLVDPAPEALAALRAHLPTARSYSPTALQNFAACPYRFLLQAIHRLAPREEPEAIEELDPLQRGSLVHEVLYELLVSLRDEGRLPLQPADFESLRDRLDEVVARVAARFRDELAPAIDRVWDDGVASIRADVRDWLRRAVEPSPWVPWRFELSFGLGDRRAQDPASTVAPVTLATGLHLRGSIDLVERAADGSLRATDYKTGKARTSPDAVVGGGATLQPVLYALALERLFPDARVAGGRLYFCTSAGQYKEVVIPLDDYARGAAGDVLGIVSASIESGFLPAAPGKGACEWCDYRAVCGPNEEQRARKKAPERLVPLERLREMP